MTGKVVRIDKDEVLVDIGYKSEGVIPQNELSIRRSIDPAEEVQLGEEVDALVLTKEDQDGRLILSKKRARFERAWRRIEAAAESGEPVEGTVIEVVKGGLIIDLGVRGFLPASLVDIRRVQNLDEYLGQKIECKVIELNRSRNNVVLSRRAVLEEERKEARQQILDRLQRGEVVEGTISNIVDFGAFVDLDGIDGLIHISELSWGHVNHPSEVLIDRRDGDASRCSTSTATASASRSASSRRRRTRGSGSCSTYNVGDVLEGKVTKVVSFGAFVEIMEGVEGLVHISELAQHHVENPREVVEPGDDVKVKILEIDEERRRLSLSLKRVEGQVLPRRELAPVEPVDDQEVGEQDVPDLGLSDEVFAPEAEAATPRRPPRRRPSRAAPRRPRPRPRSLQPRSRPPRSPPPRSPRSLPRKRSRPRRRPKPQSPSRRPTSRPDAVAVRRLDRGHRLRQVGGAGRLRAARAPRRSRATRSCTTCSATDRGARPAARALGRPASLTDGEVDRAAVAAIVFEQPGGARLARGRRCSRAWASGSPRGAPGSSAAGDADVAVVEVPLLFEAGIEGVFDATIAVVADEALREERAAARGSRGRRGPRRAPALAGREGGTCRPRDPQRRHARRSGRYGWRRARRARERGSADEAARGGELDSAARAGRVPARRAAAPAGAGGRDRCSALLGAVLVAAAIALQPDGRRRDQGDHAAAAPRGRDPPAGARQEPRPGADRGRDLPRVQVPRRDLDGGRQGPDADPAEHRPVHRQRSGRHRVRAAATSRTRRSTSPTAAGTCATCSTATTATRWPRSPPTTPGTSASTTGAVASLTLDDIRFAETEDYARDVLDKRGEYAGQVPGRARALDQPLGRHHRRTGLDTPLSWECRPSSSTPPTRRSPTSPRPPPSWPRASRPGDHFQTLLGVTGSGKTATMGFVIEQVQKPDARARPQQDARGAALQRVPRVLPRQRGRVLRLLLRLLPARGLRPAPGPLHREGLLDQRRDRPPAPRGHGVAVRARGRDHRRVGLLHLRDRLARALQGEDAAASSRASGSTATRRCASSSRCSTRATTPNLARGNFRVRGEVLEVHPVLRRERLPGPAVRRRDRADPALRPAHRRDPPRARPRRRSGRRPTT